MAHTIHVNKSEARSFVHFEFVADHGDLYASFYRSERFFHFTNFNVDPTYRREGIGKALLRAALTEATALETTHFGATILSHACYDSMRSMFGDDSMHVLQLTPYDQVATSEHDGTRAALLHMVDGFFITEARRAALLKDMLYFGIPRDQRAAGENNLAIDDSSLAPANALTD